MTPMTDEQHAANVEIIQRLERIEDGVKATNGRVTNLEAWRDTQAAALDAIRADIALLAARPVFDLAAVGAVVGQELDNRRVMEDANHWRSVTRTVGSLRRRAIEVIVVLLITAVVMWLLALDVEVHNGDDDSPAPSPAIQEPGT